MQIIGVDFTSAPGRHKPITAAFCGLKNDRLQFQRLERLTDLAAFEALLARPGPWVAGFDFPFGQPRRLIETIGWPADWVGYVDHVATLGRKGFAAALTAYKADRPAGDRQHFRAADRACGAASPQTLHYTPVGLMFAEGAPRLRAAGVSLPGLAAGDPARVALEAYPGAAARRLIGKDSYKTDDRRKQSPAQAQARLRLLAALCSPQGAAHYGLHVEAPETLADDPTGDALDALICAAQAAWAHRAGLTRPEGPAGADPLEGWIADPAALAAQAPAPADAARRRAVHPVICYPVETLPQPDMGLLASARATLRPVRQVIVPARDAACFRVPAGHFFRIHSVEGPQVGDLNLWNAHDLRERFYSGKTRALHGTHLTTGHRMWSAFPFLRPMATLTHDTLGWYGKDAFGGSVHDVIGTRCDPYTHNLLSGGHTYHHCCHSNLTRALARETGLPLAEAEGHVHDVLNVFMCTGFTRDTGQYFMKASPVRPGDYLEFFAEIDLLGALSVCPGGDCSAEHSSDAAACHPLRVEILAPDPQTLRGWVSPAPNGYDRSHGA